MTTPYDIHERTFLYGCRVVDFCKPLFEGNGVIREMARQLIRAGTSVGANMEEADGGESKADFRHKVALARKEAKESQYWLRLIKHSERRLDVSAGALIQEATELVAILTAIKKNAE